MTKKFVISGYYGHNNFGDEAILSSILTELEKNFDSPEITVISNKPKTCKTKAVNKYNLFSVWRKISSCDVFISGGGSLLQDTTSFRSLLYYLFLLFLAQKLDKKTFIYAQGFTPLKSSLARKMTTSILKKVDFITVRDSESQELLSSMGIESETTADPVWSSHPEAQSDEGSLHLKANSHSEQSEESPPLESSSLMMTLKIGIQLRKWKSLNGKELYLLAGDIISIFNEVNTELEIISLCPSEDFRVLQRFSKILKQKGFKQKVSLLSGLDSEEIISHINNLDLLITMRYHAGLVAAKYGVPFLALAYDPKVKNLAKTASMPFIAINELDFYRLDKAIKYLVVEKDTLKENLLKISAEKAFEAGKTVIYLKDMLEEKDEFAKK